MTYLKPISYLFLLVLLSGIRQPVIAEDHSHEHKSEELEKTEHAHHIDEGHSHEVRKNHGEHKEAELKFSRAELEEFSIKLAKAKPGVINKTLNLTGEVVVAPERLHHIVPRVSGVVRQILKHLGDEVKEGDLLATLSSRDLADAKAQYVAADSLLLLANASLKRQRNLYKNKVTAQRKYLAAKQFQLESSIKRKASLQRLLTIGLTEKAVNALLRNADKELALYELRAPAAGIIIEKHAALGEVLETDSRSFTVADLSKVWVDFTVYQKDLPFILQEQQITVSTHYGTAENSIDSTISWLSPVLDKKTRSATARVIIDNATGQWRPGLFVSGKVSTSSTDAKIVIPLSALQTIEGQTIVFIQHEDGDFEPQTVQLGRRDHLQVEVLQGLTAGQTYVSENAFVLKAQSQKDSFGHGHSH